MPRIQLKISSFTALRSDRQSATMATVTPQILGTELERFITTILL
jgi:hypothetical protein